jgi:hypothetical protein
MISGFCLIDVNFYIIFIRVLLYNFNEICILVKSIKFIKMETTVITIKLVEGLDLDLKLDHEKFKKHLKSKIIEMLDTYGIDDDYHVHEDGKEQKIDLTINNRKAFNRRI